MSEFYTVIGVIILIILIFGTLPSVMVNISNWKYYKKVFKEIKNKELEHFYKDTYIVKGTEFLWFRDTNEFKLAREVYLFSNILYNLDPYHLYWWLKFSKYTKSKIDN